MEKAATSHLTGHCLCGEVSYELKASPMVVHCCHCTHCQQMSGSAFALNATIEAEKIEVTSGSVVSSDAQVKDGSLHRVYRCKSCWSPLWSAYNGRPLRSLRLGSLDQPDFFQPDFHIFVRSKLEWVVIPEGAKQFQAFYKIEEEWPEDSLLRLKLALGQK